MLTTVEKRRHFRELHVSGCFVLPNPWDVGSARFLQYLGFPAIASTSAGLAFSRGKKDGYQSIQGSLDLEETLTHLRELVQGCSLPVNADFEDGFALDRAELANNISRAEQAGVAGLSLEDNQGGVLYSFEEAVARVQVGVETLRGSGVVLVARTEGHLLEHPDFSETLRRLRAFSEVGADCLYAPGLTDADQVKAVVEVCAPKPVNVLVSSPFFSANQLRQLGVRRISVGGALARAAVGGMMRAAREILEKGTFEELGLAPTTAEIHSMLDGFAAGRPLEV